MSHADPEIKRVSKSDPDKVVEQIRVAAVTKSPSDQVEDLLR